MTVVVPKGNIEPEAGKQVTASGPSIRSFAEAVKLTGAPEAFTALTVILDGRVSTGRVLSTTVTVKLPFAVLLWESVDEQLTVVVPIGNTEPEAGKQVTGREPSTRSFAEAVKLTGAPEAFTALTVMLDGNVNTGEAVSITVTLKLAMPVFPCVSVAVQLTVAVPKAKIAPEAGEHDWELTASSGSVAEAA